MDINSKRCKECDDVFCDRPTLFVHMATYHDALESFIPPKSDLEISSPAVISAVMSPASETIVVPPPSTDLVTSTTSSSLECYICSKAFKQSYVLLQHYAW